MSRRKNAHHFLPQVLARHAFVADRAVMQANLPYDPLKDLAGVARTGFGTLVLVVTPTLGVKSAAELVALAKAQPGKLIYVSGPVGGGNYLMGTRFNLATGIKVISVSFKGTPEATIEVMAGRAHFSVLPLVAVLPFVKDGKSLALASMPERSSALPNVPALTETLPDFKQHELSMGLLAPAKTPRPILNQISKEVARILDLPDIKERLQGMGVAPAPTMPEEYDKILRAQIESLTKLIVASGLKAK